MSILITGGSGFIGSNLDGDIKLSSKDCDLKNYDETIECFREHSPEIILNCAAHHGNYQSMFKNPVEMFTQNMLININVMVHKIIRMLVYFCYLIKKLNNNLF